MNLQNIEDINVTNKIKGFESLGCSIDEQDQMLELVKLEYPDKQCVIVEHWCWNHILLDQTALCECKIAGFLPDFISSDAILQDSTGNHCRCIKSDLLCELVNNCVFVTATTCFILVNQGKFNRMTLSDALQQPFANSVNE